MDKTDFLSDPNRHFFLGTSPVPVEWVAEAWNTAPAFRDNIAYGFIRSVRKTADLDEVAGLPQLLAMFLTPAQVTQLYMDVRDRCGRWEDEWRPAFEQAFGWLASELPPSRQAVDDG